MQTEIYLAGTINKDTITHPDGRQINGYGGLLYSIIPLAQLAGDNYKIIPIVNLGRDCSNEIFKILRKYPAVSLELITIVAEPNNHCHLTYLDQESKQEILSGGVPPIEMAALNPALDSDLFLLNFISGNELTLATLEKFRSEYSGQVYIDIHSLTLGKTDSGQRYLRKPDRWQDYCATADFLQMNAVEFQLLSGMDLTRENQKSFFDQFAENLLKALLVTCGKTGAYLTLPGSTESECVLITTEPSAADADTTGCGDIFGASFCAGMISGLNPKACARLAVRTASRACLFSGIEELNFNPLK